MKLHRVTVQYEIFIIAEDEDEICDNEERIKDFCSTEAEPYIDVEEVSSYTWIEPDWRDSFPYCMKGRDCCSCEVSDICKSKTVREIAAKQGHVLEGTRENREKAKGNS